MGCSATSTASTSTSTAATTTTRSRPDDRAALLLYLVVVAHGGHLYGGGRLEVGLGGRGLALSDEDLVLLEGAVAASGVFLEGDCVDLSRGVCEGELVSEVYADAGCVLEEECEELCLPAELEEDVLWGRVEGEEAVLVGAEVDACDV